MLFSLDLRPSNAAVTRRRPTVSVQFEQNRTRAAVPCTGWCTPGMGVSVGV